MASSVNPQYVRAILEGVLSFQPFSSPPSNQLDKVKSCSRSSCSSPVGLGVVDNSAMCGLALNEVQDGLYTILVWESMALEITRKNFLPLLLCMLKVLGMVCTHSLVTWSCCVYHSPTYALQRIYYSGKITSSACLNPSSDWESCRLGSCIQRFTQYIKNSTHQEIQEQAAISLSKPFKFPLTQSNNGGLSIFEISLRDLNT